MTWPRSQGKRRRDCRSADSHRSLSLPPAHTLRTREAGIHQSQHRTVPSLKERVFRLILAVSPPGEEREVPTATFPLRKQRFRLVK